MTYNNARRSPGGFRSGTAPNHRAFDSPPRRSPGRGGGFRPMGGEGPGEFGFNGLQPPPPPPLAGQKRGFPFSGRGGSPDCCACQMVGYFSMGHVEHIAFAFLRILFNIQDKKTAYAEVYPNQAIVLKILSEVVFSGTRLGSGYVVISRWWNKALGNGCAYITYSTAVKEINDGFSLSDRLDGGNFAKLFVGSVPRTATEEDIRPLFEEHGNVIEVALIKDRKTGQHQAKVVTVEDMIDGRLFVYVKYRQAVSVLLLWLCVGFDVPMCMDGFLSLTGTGGNWYSLLWGGCCFIKYATSEEADLAIRALHNQHTLPGGVGPIQVRYADGERERLGAVEYKLFVGSLNKQATVKEVEEIFSKYGRIEDVYLMRDEKKQSRGCGFVKYSHRDMALAAINGLNGIYTMRGCEQPLIVRFADPKRPRQGDSRGLSYGGPGFGPRFDAPGTRLPSNITDHMVDRMPPPNGWRPMHPPNMGPSSNAGLHGMGPPLLPRSGDMSLPTNAGGPMTGLGGPIDGRLQVQSVPLMSQQNFNQPMPQIPPVNQQISPMQKPIQSSQELPPSHQMYPQAPVPYPQTSLRQHGQPQLPLSAGPLPQQIHGVSGQFPTSQPQTQQGALSTAIPQTPLDTGKQSNTALTTPNQQQVPPSVQQQPLQPLQQSPSPLARMLSQQTQTLQASFHSSQQAFSQLQQQLQMMQPSSQALTLQHNAETTKKQAQWAGNVAQVASTHAAAPAADVPSSTPATSSLPAAISQNMALAKCNWTEHISPEGFKYYYNSVTGESRWEKPEELTLYEQNQQQKSSVQPSQIQSQSSILPAQQVVHIQQVQPQSHLQGQVLPQQQMQQPLSSSFQAYGAVGPQNVQEVGYKQTQASVISGGEPGRYSQGIYSTQDLMWKNKPADNVTFYRSYEFGDGELVNCICCLYQKMSLNFDGLSFRRHITDVADFKWL
ncbi:hypothetical protein Fmac_013379 [Flemingia macrophylla]|uniref:Flowering time control protein FCA n=1 Tax=Flemingia macrophylla TaxID=520843 RepID=A0ABD1MSZ3_9FABA